MQDGISVADGFAEITESLAEMIKYVANEPSVGLFYIQQHAHKAIPNVVKLKDSVGVKSHETALHTEDAEDSILTVKSMKDCGLPIADEMIADIKRSLSIVSAKQPKKGLISSPMSSFHTKINSSSGSSSWGWSSSGLDPEDIDKKSGYFSNVFKSAKQTAGKFKWPQLDHKGPVQLKDEKDKSMIYADRVMSSSGSNLPRGESGELPLSSKVTDELQEGEEQVETIEDSVDYIPSLPEYENFKANRETKLEEWLEECGKRDNCKAAFG